MDYQLRQGDKLYIFSICIVENGIRLSCKNTAGKKYSQDFTVLDINGLDPIFNEIKSEQEAVKFIDKALNSHKVAVFEDGGIIKIIFYTTTKGIIHTIEIPLRESGNNVANDNAIASSANTLEVSQPIEVAPQTLGSVKYSNGGINNYAQQSLYSLPVITPVKDETATQSNFNVDEYMSQLQTSGNVENDNTYSAQEVTTGSNTENIGSFMLQGYNQYTQTNFEATTSTANYGDMNTLPVKYLPTKIMSGNDENANSYEFSSNQYATSTDNNYITSGYDNSYQTTGATFDINSLNIQQSYEDNINQYPQPIIGSADYTQQLYQEYETASQVKSTNDNILPIITPADPLENYKFDTPLNPQLASTYEGNTFMQSIQSQIGTSQYETHTTPVVTSSLHLPISQTSNEPQYQTSTNVVSNSQFNQNIYSTQYIPETTQNNNIDYNTYFQQTTTEKVQNTEQYAPLQVTNNVETLSLQKDFVQPQTSINQSELQQTTTQTAETANLQSQTEELDPLKKQMEEMAVLKSQLLELNSLRAKVAEFDSLKAQLEELNSLREQVGQMNILKQQLEELNDLRSRVAETENLRRKVEELEREKIEYENEIKELRETQRHTQSDQKSDVEAEGQGLESKQLTLENKAEQICVKGDIIHDTNELEMITRKINKLNKNLTLNLLYKATADSDKAKAFHGKCDDAQSTIVLVETDKGKRFGGYTTCSWSGDCIEKNDEEAFVFSLDKMKTYGNIPGEVAIGCYPKFGPIFMGCQIRIYDNAFDRGGTTFEKGLNFNTEEDFELTDGERTFNVKEIEVYEVITQ